MIHPEKYYRLYFGRNADYYMSVLYQFDNGKKFVFNFFAFIFGLMWFMYRKMFLVFLIVWLVTIFQGQIETICIEKYNVTAEGKNLILLFSTLLWGTVFGFFGNKWYVNQADKVISKVVELDISEDEKELLIAQKGNITFIPHLLIILILSIIVAMGKQGLFGL